MLQDHSARIASIPADIHQGKIVRPEDAGKLLASVIHSGDRVVLEGDNQKQARFLSQQLAELSKVGVKDLHILQSSVVLDEHLEVFRRGVGRQLDFAFSGPQAVGLAKLVNEGKVKIGAIHTYPELYSRYFCDLIPNVALVTAELADKDGNLYTGCNTEETPVICEATHGGKGIVIAQVAQVVDKLPRVDIPGDQVEFVVPTGQQEPIEALFTRDPAKITRMNILMAMLTIKGIYQEYGVTSLNHGIGYAPAAIELLLPTYAASLGLKGKICTHWALNPHPTLIPAIEAGFVKTIHSFGSEPGMDDYIAARSDVFFTCHEGVLKSNRLISHLVGFYGIDCFVGSTLQIDGDGNSSTATKGRISGFGGAPNLGSNAGGRRHPTATWTKMGQEMADSNPGQGIIRGRKMVVQIVPTVSEKKSIPVFVDQLDAIAMSRDGLFDIPPIMIYAEDLTHIVTEKGVAYLTRCGSIEQRRAAIRAIAGDTPVGRKEKPSETLELRQKKVVAYPEDLGIAVADANESLLVAHSIGDLVKASGGLYVPPPEFAH